MKTNLFSLLFGIVAMTASAKVITVSNNLNSPGQYTSAQAAADAADPGDTLYIHGSTTDYGSINITKYLVIIGAGALPDKNLALRTMISTVNFTYSADNSSTGSGSRIYGCKINQIGFHPNNSILINNPILQNIVVERNQVGSVFFSNNNSLRHHNYIIKNNVIGQIGAGYRISNILLQNNILMGISTFGSETYSTNLLISNNVITGGISIENTQFTNNIVYYNNANPISSSKNNTFTKNIFFSNTNTLNSTLFNNVSGNSNNAISGNILNQNPDFENFTGNSINDLVNYTYSYPSNGSYLNFNLKSNSPGRNYGTDGTDVGIYGGTTPFREGSATDGRLRYFPEPAIPQMQDMIITNTSVPTNGTLNVNISAHKQD